MLFSSLHLGSGGISACHARIKTPARPFGESRTLACVGAEHLWATAAFPCRRCSAYREVRRSAGGGGGFPPPGFLGTLSPQKEFPWGSGGRSAPAKGGVGDSPHKSAGGPKARTAEGPPAGGPKALFRKTTDPHPPASAGKKPGGPGAARPRQGTADPRKKAQRPRLYRSRRLYIRVDSR
mgnify:CR=1 FL=1